MCVYVCVCMCLRIYGSFCMDAPVAHLMHIHELAGLVSCIIHVLLAISGCPVSYGVSYESTLALTQFRCSTHLLNLQPLNLA